VWGEEVRGTGKRGRLGIRDLRFERRGGVAEHGRAGTASRGTRKGEEGSG